jgi:hypothetical protein
MLSLPLVLALAAAPAPVVHHALEVKVDPAAGTIAVVDEVTLPEGWEGRAFGLYQGLEVKGLKAAEAVPSARGSIDHDAQTARFRAWAAPAGQRTFTVEYSGRLVMPPEQEPEEYARSFQRTSGTIQEEGVYLSAASGWIPRFGDELFTFDLVVKDLPSGWSALSEGSETRTGWSSKQPLDDVHLIAAKFWRREKAFGTGDGQVNVIALLRDEDPALAGRYIDATGRYLAMYEELIGPFPYDKFALVENFWETGYGMPSFTLLGPQVIRFPFILHSSYPHELLHNWWGNSVFLDGGGNWCEGLTAYLADHLIAEQRGRGAEHRRRTLARYRDFVTPADDFPLKDFRGRTSPSSEAVGYGKWAMVAHMLRLELGDAKFKAALRRFFQDNKFQRAGFGELRAAFEAEAGRSLEGFFAAWIDRAGAPIVQWSDVKVSKGRSGAFTLEVTLEQADDAPAFPQTVPIRASLQGGGELWLVARFDGESRFATTVANAKARPLQLDIDPRYDVFRRLDPFETPPSLSVALGEDKTLMVLPTFSSKKELAAWRKFTKKVCKPGACVVKMDKDVGTLPADRAIWVLGYGNSLRAAAIVGASAYGAAFDDSRFVVDGQEASNGARSTALAFRHPRAPRKGLVFVGADNVEAIAGLARKLPHYGKYSYLSFQGKAPDNVLKGTWSPKASPMRVALRGKAQDIRLRPRKALAELPPPFDGARMLAFAKGLADPKWQGRGLKTPGLAQALAATEKALADAGLKAERQCFQTAAHGETCNVVARVRGRNPKLAPVVLGAHVDHLGVVNGKVHPGANDNASGVAVLVEVARALAAEGPFTRGVEVVVFSAEETGTQGSEHYVAQAKRKPFAMVNLDTVGRASGRPFLVLGSESATEWVHIFRGIGFVSGVRTKMGAKGLDASDHSPFLAAGVPAVQLFSGPDPDYHRPGDTADKLEVSSLVQAATLAKESITYLAGRTDPLTVSGEKPTARKATGRKVSLGTVPDFTFKGPGVRLTGVTPHSPAAQAGLQAGDIVVKLGDRDVKDLRGLADALRAAKAGQKLKLEYLRDGKRRTAEVELKARR